MLIGLHTSASGRKHRTAHCIKVGAGADAGAIASCKLKKSGELACYDGFAANLWALNSAVECHLHTVEVIGSNPIAPTIFINGLARLAL